MIAANLPAVVIYEAVQEYRLHGYVLPDPLVNTVASNGVFVAETLPGHIVVTSDVARSMVRLARITAKPTVRLRAAAYRSCGVECVYASYVALHEVAHLVQYQYAGITGSDQRIEGLADAVAYDLHGAFIRRIIGSYPTGCGAVPRPDLPGKHHVVKSKTGCAWYWQPQLAYQGYVLLQRNTSAAATGVSWTRTAARTWRMGQLSVGVGAPHVDPIYGESY